MTKSNLEIVKTIKLFVGGKFPRTESGRSFEIRSMDGHHFANLCLASRKDWRDAVESSSAGLKDWSNRTAYNRGQILYRMAEMMESKRSEFANLMTKTGGMTDTDANSEMDSAISAFVYYAGFSDKFQQLSGTINPINGPYGNTTSPEPVGITALILSKSSTLSSACARIASILVGGNSVCVHIDLDGNYPAVIAPLSEVLATSDLPNGVVNLLTGQIEELREVLSQHMDIRSVVFDGNLDETTKTIFQKASSGNLKRIIPSRKTESSLHAILDTVEFKTIWQSVGF